MLWTKSHEIQGQLTSKTRVRSSKGLLTNTLITFLSCVLSCVHSLMDLSPYPAFRLWCFITWTLLDVHVDWVVTCSVQVVLKSWYEGRSESLLCMYFGFFTSSSNTNSADWLQASAAMGPISCPETSEWNYHYSLPNSPEERSSQFRLIVLLSH